MADGNFCQATGAGDALGGVEQVARPVGGKESSSEPLRGDDTPLVKDTSTRTATHPSSEGERTPIPSTTPIAISSEKSATLPGAATPRSTPGVKIVSTPSSAISETLSGTRDNDGYHTVLSLPKRQSSAKGSAPSLWKRIRRSGKKSGPRISAPCDLKHVGHLGHDSATGR